MIWNKEVSFEGLTNKITNWYGNEDEAFIKKNNDWFGNENFELCDPPIDAQYALDLIFKTLIDDKEHYPYLTTIPESTEQVNSIMLDLILRKYSREYRKYLKKLSGNKNKV